MKKPQFKAAYSLGMAAVYPAGKMDAYIKHLLTRAEVAEAKLDLVREQRDSELNRNTELEAKLAELVPSKLEEKEGDYQSLRDEKRGYNACIDKIMRNIEEQSK